ncbi:MAG: prepilin-type N-terminal cleavage/methylation domain-containing protein [Patescibacteria group bacterium]|nr:prepilin-type N-terminal cleavage/methylation domain-containing protein [Patescibacteria group bacterium]
MRKFLIFNFQFSKKKAFTLLEMLVVIGIIAIILSLGSVSYSTAQKKARDAKRKQDLKAIQNALEQYYSICGYQYPTPVSQVFNAIICSSVNPTVAILPTVPVDPKTTPYRCNPCSNSEYRICSNNMEAEIPTGYCLSNQQ